MWSKRVGRQVAGGRSKVLVDRRVNGNTGGTSRIECADLAGCASI